MNNPKNALMQKMTDKVMRGGKSPASQKVKTPEYKEFQTDSTILSENTKNPNKESTDYILNKYPLGGESLPRVQKSYDFIYDASASGFQGKKYEDSPKPPTPQRASDEK